MRTTIDAAGRVVIPKRLREAARLTPGTELEVSLVGSTIEIRSRPLAVRLERRGRLVVAVPQGSPPPLETATVEEARAALQREREEGAGGGA